MVIDDSRYEAHVLRRVQVRELREHERSEFDWRLEEQHYLASSDLVGETLTKHTVQSMDRLETVLEADRWAREEVRKAVG